MEVVLAKTCGRSAFHSQLKEVGWASGPESTAGASVCLPQLDPINDCIKCAVSFRSPLAKRSHPRT
jgi:hypothetical protein